MSEYKEIEFAEIDCIITSTVHYYDGHTEEGPHTRFKTQVNDADTGIGIAEAIGRTIDKMQKKSFAERLLGPFKEIIVPASDEDKKRSKLKTVYHCSYDFYVEFPDGSSKEKHITEEVERFF